MRIGTDFRGSGHDICLLHGIRLEGLRKTTKTSVRVAVSEQRFEPGPPKYLARVATTQPRLSVSFNSVLSTMKDYKCFIELSRDGGKVYFITMSSEKEWAVFINKKLRS
jgi:hypothetical protein